MNYLHKTNFTKVFILINQTLFLSSMSFANENNHVETGRNIGRFLSHINTIPIGEGAGSHGSYGIKVSVEGQFIPRPTSEDPEAKLITLTDMPPDDFFYPRISIVRGMPFPVDVGVGFSRLNDAGAQQWSGHLQWTFFERHRWPALASRYSMSKIFGDQRVQLSTQNIEFAFSYGFLRFFNLYFTKRYSLHSLTYRTSQFSTEEQWVDSSQGGGIELMVLPPFTSISLGAQKGSRGEISYSSKLSYLL